MTALNRRSFLSSLGVLGAGFALRGRFSTACPILTEVDVKPGEMINGFNHDLYRELKGEAGNVFYSPFSISTCLGMTAAGARKNTLAQMQNVLHLPSEAGAQDAAYAQLMAQMNSEKAGVTLSTANAIWAQKGYPWRPEFRDRVAKYGAGMKDADFATQFEAERKAINTWVEETTKSRIKDLLQAGDLDAMTRMVLVNAIYFKGSWADAFEAKATKDAPFTQLDGTKKNVPLMVRKGKYTLHEQDDAQVLSLPYKGNELSMWVALPRAADGLPALEKSLTASRFEDWAKAAKPVNDLLVYLPKFKIEVRYPLNRHLIKLGMGDAFSDIKADFRGMHSGDKELYLSLVVHKAFVEVNEEGTEAAAATGAVMKLRSAPAKPKLFRADHPFLFAIRHNASGAILFQGRMGQV